MKVDYAPVYLLRSYIWGLLKANTDMKESDYGTPGLVPIVPVAEAPELEQFSKPYIVYGYANDPTSTNENYRQRGSMSMAIYSTNFHQITNLLTILSTVFNEEDKAAKTVNEYTSTIPQFVGLRFSTISVGFLEGPSPEETEGGRESGLINIRYEYYVDYQVKVFKPAGASVMNADGTISNLSEGWYDKTL